MASSGYHQWESDPLFSAAEVVQDSADRMESIFRLLSHEQGLLQGPRPDHKLLASIEYHRRDLATNLETANWQLEDFEREVTLSASTDKSQTRQIAISRHKQFIIAIREQIAHVKKSLEDSSVGDSVRNEWVNLNEQDRDGLALFLSGGKSVEHVKHHDLEDHSMMIRFLDPSSSSSFNNEIVVQKTRETVSLNMNGFAHLNNDFDLKDEKLRNAGSHYSAQMGSEVPSSMLEAPCDRHDEKESWDLEANETSGKSFFLRNKLGGLYRKMSLFGSFRNLISAYGSRGCRNFTKKWKDEEEQEHSLPTDISHAAQCRSTRMGLATGWSSSLRLWPEMLARVLYFCRWLRDCLRRYQGLRTI